MVRLIARAAVAAGLAAAVAAPFTQGALADTLPTTSVPSVPALPAPLNQLVPLPVAAPTTSSTSTSSTSTSSGDPSSSAEGDALNLPGLNTCIGCSNGTSSTPPASSQANATGVKVLGINVANGSASGDQTSTGGVLGTNAGDTIAVPLSPLVTLAVADWFAKATSTPSTFERAALLDLNVNPDGSPATQSALYPLAYLAVLEGQSATSADCATGGASASSNGARLGLGNKPDGSSALAVILLHNGASTTDSSQNVAYLASINGNTIGTNSQAPQHTITIPGLLSLNLLVAPSPSCGTNPPAGCVTNCSGTPGCPPGVLSIELPPGTCLGTGVSANSGGTTGGAPATNVQSASTGSTGGGTGVPSTGIALGILGFLLLGGGLIAMAASRFARRWRRLA